MDEHHVNAHRQAPVCGAREAQVATTADVAATAVVAATFIVAVATILRKLENWDSENIAAAAVLAAASVLATAAVLAAGRRCSFSA